MPEPVVLALIALLVLCCGAAVVWMFLPKRPTPEQVEHDRRLAVNSQGRLVEGLVRDVQEKVLHYDYSWQGTHYGSSQDISALQHLVRGEVHGLIGPATIKFDARNPYNSIVICEKWSGFPKEKLSPP